MEEWRSVPEFPDYEVSNTGLIRSLRFGKIKLLKIQVDGNGYRFIFIRGNGSRKKKKIARLVAGSFLPNPDNLRTVDHIDRNRLNDHISNLRWASDLEQYKNRNYVAPQGKEVHNSIWTDQEVLEIKRLNSLGFGKRKIAKMFNCSITQAQSAITNWKHLG